MARGERERGRKETEKGKGNEIDISVVDRAARSPYCSVHNHMQYLNQSRRKRDETIIKIREEEENRERRRRKREGRRWKRDTYVRDYSVVPRPVISHQYVLPYELLAIDLSWFKKKKRKKYKYTESIDGDGEGGRGGEEEGEGEREKGSRYISKIRYTVAQARVGVEGEAEFIVTHSSLTSFNMLR